MKQRYAFSNRSGRFLVDFCVKLYKQQQSESYVTDFLLPFYRILVTETLRFQIIFVTLRHKIKHKDYENKNTIQRQKTNDDEGENS